jgi:hypothetical protein
MEDDELPPPIDDPDAMDDYWFEKTTITVDRWCKAQLDYERDGKPSNEYLEELRQAKADPLTLNDTAEIADVILDELQDGLSMAADPGVPIQAEEFEEMMQDIEELKRMVDRTDNRTAIIQEELEQR